MIELEKVTNDIEKFAKPLRDFIKRKHYRGDMLVQLDYVLMKIGEWQKTVEKLFENRPKAKRKDLYGSYEDVPSHEYEKWFLKAAKELGL